jgi:hypothetical protein
MARPSNVSVQVGRGPTIVPDDWPLTIYCPTCKEYHRTEDYIFLGREHKLKDLLYRILRCPVTKACFAPSEQYLRQYGR